MMKQGIFFLTGFLAAFASLLLEVLLSLFSVESLRPTLRFLISAGVEEGMKFIFLGKIISRFSDSTQSSLFSVFLFAFGFLTAELSVFLLGMHENLPASLEMIIFGFLGVTAVHLGTVLTLFTGLSFREKSTFWPFLALVIATFAHTLYNLSLFR